jgi:hypothetical protein
MDARMKLSSEAGRLRAALDRIAKQPLKCELEQEEEGDFEFAYNELIKWAREALGGPSTQNSDLGNAVRDAREAATGRREPPTPKRSFA